MDDNIQSLFNIKLELDQIIKRGINGEYAGDEVNKLKWGSTAKGLLTVGLCAVYESRTSEEKYSNQKLKDLKLIRDTFAHRESGKLFDEISEDDYKYEALRRIEDGSFYFSGVAIEGDKIVLGPSFELHGVAELLAEALS